MGHSIKRRRRYQFTGAFCVLAAGACGHAQEIRTPAASPTPQVNGPDVFGARPNSPFSYKIPATGNGTLLYSATGLPAGLSVDPASGVITGSVAAAGNYPVTLWATNSLGTSTRNFTIKIGNTIGLTPAMGWSSWNVWNRNVTAARVETAADVMASSGLINHGWSYVNTDDAWQGARGGAYNGIQPNATYLGGGYTMQGMVDHIHSLGLKAGIYSTPWIQSYEGFIGGSANNPAGTFTPVNDDSQKHLGTFSFATNDANQWATWGIDYMKYDWNPGDPFSVPDSQFHDADAAMQQALLNTGRNILYSYSNNMPMDQASDQATLLNAWRWGQDIEESYASVKSNGFGHDAWAPFQSPGHFNDPDMLEVGWVGNGSAPHPTALTPEEQYTHITQWCLLGAPLILGCDLSHLDAFTMNLITNDEVIAVDQDALAQQATRKKNTSTIQIYAKTLEDGTMAVGLFNTGSSAQTVTALWSDLGISGSKVVRDLWREQDMGLFGTQFGMTVAAHGAELIKIAPLPSGVTMTWKGGADGTTWNLSAANFYNGASNTAFSNGGGVLFDGSAPTTATTINIPANISPSVVVVNSSNRNYTFQGAGAISGSGTLIKNGNATLTISNANTITDHTAVNGGKLALAGNLSATSLLEITGGTLELTAGGGSSRVIRAGSIFITGGGKLDLQDNKLIVTGGSAYTAVTGLIAAGRGSGNTWNGMSGIVTSQSAAVGSNYTSLGVARASEIEGSITALWAGQTVSPSDTLVMYTYGGDANLDGKLNIDDYIRIDSGIASGLTGWSNGDFNYDGKVNIDDYTQFIDANVGIQGAQFPTSGGNGGNGASAVAVPEPIGCTTLLFLASAVASTRRRLRRER